MEQDILTAIPVDKLDAIGVFLLVLVAMILFFCYKTYKKKD